jgi:hypothetical protein
MAIPVTADVTSLPLETEIVVPEFLGEPAKTWKVDEAERIDPEHWRLVVVPA